MLPLTASLCLCVFVFVLVFVFVFDRIWQLMHLSVCAMGGRAVGLAAALERCWGCLEQQPAPMTTWPPPQVSFNPWCVVSTMRARTTSVGHVHALLRLIRSNYVPGTSRSHPRYPPCIVTW